LWRHFPQSLNTRLYFSERGRGQRGDERLRKEGGNEEQKKKKKQRRRSRKMRRKTKEEVRERVKRGRTMTVSY
jgi:hypothetical protein